MGIPWRLVNLIRENHFTILFPLTNMMILEGGIQCYKWGPPFFLHLLDESHHYWFGDPNHSIMDSWWSQLPRNMRSRFWQFGDVDHWSALGLVWSCSCKVSIAIFSSLGAHWQLFFLSSPRFNGPCGLSPGAFVSLLRFVCYQSNVKFILEYFQNYCYKRFIFAEMMILKRVVKFFGVLKFWPTSMPT